MIRLPLNTGAEWEMPPEFERLLMENYSDLHLEMRKALIWLEANPHRRKTPRGIKQFCVNWLNNAGKLKPQVARPLSIVRAEQPRTQMPESFKALVANLRHR